jgi:hypothetical protein
MHQSKDVTDHLPQLCPHFIIRELCCIPWHQLAHCYFTQHCTTPACCSTQPCTHRSMHNTAIRHR